MFTLHKTTPLGRSGMIHTGHGELRTPLFMPVGTAGAMKGISHEHLRELGAEILLCNTYHLHLQPGETIIEAAGGLHRFISWEKPILTDSGGFQVFSLRSISSISDKGVAFRSHRNGDLHFIGPEESITIQHKLGSDIIMCFDECPPSTAGRAAMIKAVDRTLKWAAECKKSHERFQKSQRSQKDQKKHASHVGTQSSATSETSDSSETSLLFGIIQGGLERDLRKKCAEELMAIGFDGYAVGGLAVGETEDEMYGVLEDLCPVLPKDCPRYLMGVGKIDQLKRCVSLGIDMFDCVLPVREARHGNIYTSDGRKIRITKSDYRTDHTPIDPGSKAVTSRTHLKSYLHHLLKSGERYGETIACLQNLSATLEAISYLRASIDQFA